MYAEGMRGKDRSTRWLAGASAFVAALALVAIVVALVVGRGDPEALPSDSPEGTVQRYLQAIADRDYDSAYALVDPAVREQCSANDFRHAAHWFEGRQFSARLTGIRTFADETEVSLRISESFEPPPLGRGEVGQDVHYRLAEVDGVWLLTSFGYPVRFCAGPRGLPQERPTAPRATPTPAEAA